MLRALPLVSRAEETAALRAAAPGERGCIRGEGCAALRLPRGHLPPRFKHFTQCVVCLRAQALDVWLSNLVAEEKVHAQEFRNIIGEGEYSAEACIQPCTRGYDGITDPIVRFCPLRLIWEGTRLKQKNVDFVLVPVAAARAAAAGVRLARQRLPGRVRRVHAGRGASKTNRNQ